MGYWHPEQPHLTTLWVSACLLRAVAVIMKWDAGSG
jgi:hypothetical protein